MRMVIYSMSVSLDGFIAGPDGAIDWAAPDEELMAFHNAQGASLVPTSADASSTRTCFRGRPTPIVARPSSAGSGGQIPKIVLSTTLDRVEGNATLATESLTHELAQLTEGSGGHDEILVLVAPILLGDGVRLFDRPGGRAVRLEQLDPGRTGPLALWYRVAA